MKFYKSQHEGLFFLEASHKALVMTREEAETLFVQIGHVLQDDDITRYGDETGANDPSSPYYNDGLPSECN